VHFANSGCSKNLRNLGAVQKVTSISGRVSDTQSLCKKKKKKKKKIMMMMMMMMKLYSIIDFIQFSKDI
jgi:hypothetical protein